jgi:phospholipase/carboxylesterase
MKKPLTHITLDSGSNPQYSIIWLHGLGADGQDFVPMVEELQIPVAVRYIFPNAPRRAVTINGGYVMRAWYDIASDRIDAQQDAAGIRESATSIEELITQEVARGIKPSHIFLAGFSQGAAIALHTALRYNLPLAGLLVLSGYVPLAETLITEVTPPSRYTPIFMGHGRHDTIVPFGLGTHTRDTLLALGYHVEWQDYPMEHSVNNTELRDIEAWLCDKIVHLSS